jgi:hypothetical protein
MGMGDEIVMMFFLRLPQGGISQLESSLKDFKKTRSGISTQDRSLLRSGDANPGSGRARPGTLKKPIYFTI